ncbi:GNAT family N-acetyltransferase [Pseudonocardia sp. KRD-176]|nr:GNAT family N-acetyltransferase [Pseudonocardia oceani]
MGAWRLRAAGGYTARANTALALGDPGMPVPDALDAVRAFAAAHGVPPRVTVPAGSPWDTAVGRAGWTIDVGHGAGAEVAVLVADLRTLDAGGAAVGQVRASVVEDHLHLAWLEVVPAARRRGLGTDLVAAAAAWGRGRGARFGVLQVALRNTGARALYASTGWTEHHRYRHLVPVR